MSVQAETGIGALYDVSLPDHPYPGLRPFRKDEWAIFFGRENIIEHVTGDLITNRFVSVHGDSGSGKSSLVHAGVLPRLVQDLGRGGATWRTASMEPGNAPLRNLAEALAELSAEAGGESSATRYRRILNLGADAASALVSDLRRGEQDHLCILVDQFEEIFAFASEGNRTEAELFIEVLTGIQRQKPDGLHVILTMRSEYLGACARFAGLAEAINDSQYLLPPMRRSALIRAISEPALLYGGRVETDLAEQLIADTGGTVDQLPLIQHGLMLMQRKATGGPAAETGSHTVSHAGSEPRWTLTLEDYRKTSGVADLLSDHADRVMDGIAAKHELGGWIIETVFRALTDIDADGHAIRRRQTLQELADISTTDPAVVSTTDPAVVADALLPLRQDGVSFLRPYGDRPLKIDDEITISHEALIRCWKKIADPKTGWLQREFQDGLIWKSLLVAADGFRNDPTAVLSPAVTEERGFWMLVRNPTWAKRYGGRFDDVQNLLQASEREMRRQKTARSALGFAGIALVVLGVFAFNIWSKSQERAAFNDELAAKNSELTGTLAKLEEAFAEIRMAQAETKRAYDELIEEQNKLEAAERENNKLRSQLLAQKSAQAIASGDAGSGLAMALEVMQNQVALPYVPEAERQIYSALNNLRERTVLRSQEDTGKIANNIAAFDPGGTRIVSAGADGRVRVWAADGRSDPQVMPGYEGGALSAAFSRDGERIVSSGEDGTVRIWAANRSGEPLVLKDHDGPVRSAAFSPDGTHIVSAGEDGTVKLWPADGSGEPLVLKSSADRIWWTSFSPDGTRVVSAGEDGAVRLWTIGTDEQLVLNGHKGAAWFAAFDSTGKRIVSAGSDRTVRVWAIDGSREQQVLRGHDGGVWSAAFSPDSQQIVSSGVDGSVRVWAVNGGIEPLVLNGHEGAVFSAAYSPDGKRVVSAGGDGTVRIWTAEPVLSVQRAGPSLINDNPERIIEQASREKLGLSAWSGRNSIAISPSGERIIRSTGRGQYGVWHPHENQELVADRELDLTYPFVIATGFAGERRVAILAPESPLRPFRFLIGNRHHDASSMTLKTPDAVAFAPEQNRVAMYFSDPDHIELYDLKATPRLVARVQVLEPEGNSDTADAGSYLLGFDPGGKTLAGVSRSGDRMFTIDWQSMKVLPEPEGERPYMFDARVNKLKRSGLHEIMALHVGADLVSVVAIPLTRSLNDLVVGDLLNPESFQTIRPGPNERRPISAAFGADGNRVVLVSEQGISLYSREQGGVVGRFAIQGKQAAVAAFAADGAALAATSADGTIGYWRIFPTTEALKEFAEDVAPRRLTAEQIQDFLEPPKTKD